MTEAKPLLFLDVDGVLNCLGMNPGTYERVNGENTYACVPLGTRTRLAKVLPHYEPVWATAWRGRAHSHFREHLGLSEVPWPWLDWVNLKLPVILRYAGNRPWAWVDDDAEWEYKQLAPAFRELPNSLVVVPDGRVGLTDQHVDQLITFSEQVQRTMK